MKLFSEKQAFAKAGNSASIISALKQGSRNEMDAQARHSTYEKLFSNYEEAKNEHFKMFSGTGSYAQTELLGNQYFNATLMGLAKSMAGYLSIERDMDQAIALLWYYDFENITAGNIALPNLGQDNLGGIEYEVRTAQNLSSQTNDFTYTKRLMPGSVRIVVTFGSTVYNITDDRSGVLLGNPGLLAATSLVNYETGLVRVNFASALPGGTNTIVVNAAENQTALQNDNRFQSDLKYIQVTTYPEVLTAEMNLVSIAAQKKAMGTNYMDVSISKLTELYTKKVNQKLVNAIVQQDAGNAVTINMAPTQFYDYRSILDKFTAQLVDVDTAMAIKSYKGVKATAYVVGTNVATIFRKLKQYGSFVEAPQSYINDLVGFYNGIPVLQHTDIDANTGFAVHKTSDGQLAPCLRGMFLPLTNTPAIGNFASVTQTAAGVFYQEKNQGIAPALQQRFTISGYVA